MIAAREQTTEDTHDGIRVSNQINRRARHHVLKKVLLASASLLAGLILCEIVARLLFPAPQDLGHVPKLLYQFDPEIGYVQLPNQKGWIDDALVTVNSLGCRGEEVRVPKPVDCRRILVMGDSVTLGLGVEDDQCYCVRLERSLQQRFPGRDVDVVNGAVSGYNTRREISLLARLAPRLEPSLVLIGFYMNDVPDALSSDKRQSTSLSGTNIVAKNPQAGQILHMHPT